MTFNAEEFSTVVDTIFSTEKEEDWFIAQIVKTVDKMFGADAFMFQHAHYVTIMGPSNCKESEPYEATLIVYFEKEENYLTTQYVDLMKQIAYDVGTSIYPTYQADTTEFIIFTAIEL